MSNLRLHQIPKYIKWQLPSPYKAEKKRNFSEIIASDTVRYNPKVIVIGAGLSGLSAAHYLRNNGIENIMILEASNRYGGRIHSLKIGNTNCELGAGWIDVTRSPYSVYGLAKECGLIEGKNICRERNNHFFVTSNGVKLDTKKVEKSSVIFSRIIRVVRKMIDEMGEKLQLEGITLDKCIRTEIDKTVCDLSPTENVYIRHVCNNLLRDLSNTFGCDLGYVNVLQLKLKAESNTNPIYLISGLQEICNHLIDSIPQNQLLLGKPVIGIRWANLDKGEKPYVKCVDGSKYIADYIICTFPLGVLKTFSEYIFSPQLPVEKMNAISQIGFGYPGKIFLEYDEPVESWFIGGIKLAWSFNELIDRTDWTTRISKIKTVPNSSTVLEVGVGGSVAENIERYDEDFIVQDITATLKKFTNNKSVPYPKKVVRTLWSTNPRSLGGIAYLSVTTNQSHIDTLAEPLGLTKTSKLPVLLFAGDATIWDGFGSLEGARRSGVREAKRIVNIIRKSE